MHEGSCRYDDIDSLDWKTQTGQIVSVLLREDD